MACFVNSQLSRFAPSFRLLLSLFCSQYCTFCLLSFPRSLSPSLQWTLTALFFCIYPTH